MNNKGFTLVELLATIIILGLITSIGTLAYTGYLKNTKEKTEEVFKKNISDYIDAFITSNTNELTNDTLAGKSNNIYIQKYNNHSITFQDIIDNNIITTNNLKNSANKKTCSENTNITVYRDNNYVYCFAVELDCVDSNNILTNCSSYITDRIGETIYWKKETLS